MYMITTGTESITWSPKHGGELWIQIQISKPKKKYLYKYNYQSRAGIEPANCRCLGAYVAHAPEQYYNLLSWTSSKVFIIDIKKSLTSYKRLLLLIIYAVIINISISDNYSLYRNCNHTILINIENVRKANNIINSHIIYM